MLGADSHERSEERLGYRNGHRPRSSLATQALNGVVMEANIGDISTRKVDALVAALGAGSDISKSQVSRICQDIDQRVQVFLNRPLQESGYSYIFLDATYLHGRLGKAMQVCSRAAVIAMGVNVDGRRELLGLQVGERESEGFWKAFIGSLKEPGLTGVKLVISEAHLGLTKAIRRMFQGCCWQRCRVHFARNLLQRVPKAPQGMVTAALRSVFSQEVAVGLVERWDALATSLDERFPRTAEL
ncbi:MAG: transposase [Cyanobacteria bacterium]|nr:transposase [Cyanobacteriota bacterium]